MCLAVIAVAPRPGLALVIAANRDEFHARPAAPAGPWTDHPDVYAGRDLSAGGTWLGMTRSGRYALLTNFRDPRTRRDAAPSRGALVRDYLVGAQDPGAYADDVHARAAQYNGFNLIVGDARGCVYLENRTGNGPRRLPSGVHGLSNHLLNTPWPKLARIREAVDEALRLPGPDADVLFDILADRTPARDEELPDTGIGLERERLLSAPFIVSPDYGTRCSTVIIVREDGQASVRERRFTPAGEPCGESDFAFTVVHQGRPA